MCIFAILGWQALSLAKEEADAAIAMQKESLAVEQEIRYYKLGANTISMWKNLREVPQWLHSDELLHLEQQKAKMLQKVEAADAALRAKRDDVEFTSIRYPEYDMIKSGKFGPDIEEFAMPLPATFPVRAGQAKFALKPVLVQHEKVISKLKVQALPNTLEEVKVTYLFFNFFKM